MADGRLHPPQRKEAEETEWRTDEGRKAKFALANSPRIRYICVRKTTTATIRNEEDPDLGTRTARLGSGSASAQLRIGGRKINTSKLLSAGKDVAQAVTLSDKDIADLSREAVTWMDENNPVAPDSSEYVQRLKRLTEGITDADGLPLNFKVYLVTDVNAFACGDGSIRVFSSLMDLMDDDQLMAIIGHEIGHVVHADVKHAMKNAYLASAARNAAGAAEGSVVAKLSESQLGDVVTAFTDAQFSQKQEYAADEYGFEFATSHGFSPYAMYSALNRLLELSQGEKASRVQKIFSSHPDTEQRAARMKEKADALATAE